MRKFGLTIACILTAAAAIIPQATDTFAQKTASANAVPVTTANETLLSPTAYEEYLHLNAPSDVSVADGFTAIADGNRVYLYDQMANEYKRFDHTREITKLQFSEASVLYFLDKENTLYTLNVTTLTATETGISNCLTFTLHGSNIYYTTMSGISTSIYSAPITAPANKTQLIEDRMYCPAIAFSNGALYYMKSDEYLRKYTLADGSDVSVAELPAVLSLTITENTLVCTSENGGFKAFSLTDNGLSEIYSTNGEYSSLCAKGENVYVIKGNTIRNFSISSTAFTNFEIASASSSAHRLNGAKNLCLKDDMLFIADVGNSRISVYNTEENAFETSISTTISPTFMASNGETLLTANATQAQLYSLSEDGYGETVSTLPAAQIHGNVIGATEVYGVYYLTTDTNRLYYSADTNGEITWTEIQRTSHTASLLTSDVYGSIYAVHGTELYRYTETEFISAAASGEKIINSLPTNLNKVLVDYERNVYVLHGNTLTVYQADNGVYSQTNQITFNESFVYGVTPTALSLAFNATDNRAYVLYQGNYLTETSALNLSTLQTIACENTQDIFTESTPQIRLTTVKKNALTIRFDITKLQSASVFPYLSHERSAEEHTALILGESGEYYVLSIPNPATGKRESCLVLKEFCQDMAESVYREAYAEPITGYLVSSAAAYKFPYLSEFLQKDVLTPDTPIQLRAKIKGLETEYYEIAYTDANEKEVIAYLPTSFVTTFEGSLPETVTQTYGEATANTDAIFRLVYILLGGFAICILVDFLILRPRNKDEDEKDFVDGEENIKD